MESSVFDDRNVDEGFQAPSPEERHLDFLTELEVSTGGGHDGEGFFERFHGEHDEQNEQCEAVHGCGSSIGIMEEAFEASFRQCVHNCSDDRVQMEEEAFQVSQPGEGFVQDQSGYEMRCLSEHNEESSVVDTESPGEAFQPTPRSEDYLDESNLGSTAQSSEIVREDGIKFSFVGEHVTDETGETSLASEANSVGSFQMSSPDGERGSNVREHSFSSGDSDQLAEERSHVNQPAEAFVDDPNEYAFGCFSEHSEESCIVVEQILEGAFQRSALSEDHLEDSSLDSNAQANETFKEDSVEFSFVCEHVADETCETFLTGEANSAGPFLSESNAQSFGTVREDAIEFSFVGERVTDETYETFLTTEEHFPGSFRMASPDRERVLNVREYSFPPGFPSSNSDQIAKDASSHVYPPGEAFVDDPNEYEFGCFSQQNEHNKESSVLDAQIQEEAFQPSLLSRAHFDDSTLDSTVKGYGVPGHETFQQDGGEFPFVGEDVADETCETFLSGEANSASSCQTSSPEWRGAANVREHHCLSRDSDGMAEDWFQASPPGEAFVDNPNGYEMRYLSEHSEESFVVDARNPEDAFQFSPLIEGRFDDSNFESAAQGYDTFQEDRTSFSVVGVSEDNLDDFTLDLTAQGDETFQKDGKEFPVVGDHADDERCEAFLTTEEHLAGSFQPSSPAGDGAVDVREHHCVLGDIDQMEEKVFQVSQPGEGSVDDQSGYEITCFAEHNEESSVVGTGILEAAFQFSPLSEDHLDDSTTRTYETFREDNIEFSVVGESVAEETCETLTSEEDEGFQGYIHGPSLCDDTTMSRTSGKERFGILEGLLPDDGQESGNRGDNYHDLFGDIAQMDEAELPVSNEDSWLIPETRNSLPTPETQQSSDSTEEGFDELRDPKLPFSVDVHDDATKEAVEASLLGDDHLDDSTGRESGEWEENNQVLIEDIAQMNEEDLPVDDSLLVPSEPFFFEEEDSHEWSESLAPDEENLLVISDDEDGVPMDSAAPVSPPSAGLPLSVMSENSKKRKRSGGKPSETANDNGKGKGKRRKKKAVGWTEDQPVEDIEASNRLTEIVIGGDNLKTIGTVQTHTLYWCSRLQSREWMMAKLGAALEAIKPFQRPPVCEGDRETFDNDVLLKMVARNRADALVFDPVTSVLRLDSSRMTFKRCKSSSNTFAIYVRIMSICMGLVTKDTFATKRDIYYQDVKLFKSQCVVDQAIEDLACTFAVPRHCLRVVASSKGLVAGCLVIYLKDGTRLDCSQCGDQGLLIPPMEKIDHILSNSKFKLTIVTLESHGNA
ncbi:endodeoxyribonuclease [Quaeritorhiza haematococci]|nr:endodeoxyribonuclease [Quaeritorhiza haematococci]